MDGQDLTVEDLKPEVKDDWIAALRSGKYRQATRYLYHDGSYCVLGVLCDVLEPEGWSKDECEGVRTHNDEPSLPSESVVRESFSHYAETWRAEKLFGNLSEKNDGTYIKPGKQILENNGYTFAELADYLEKGGAE